MREPTAYYLDEERHGINPFNRKYINQRFKEAVDQLGAHVVEGVSVLDGQAVTTDWCRHILGVRPALAKRVFDEQGVREGRST